ncbi:MAG: efflux RND transporter periplasmic adaptor subunit [Nitrospirota bacterium]
MWKGIELRKLLLVVGIPLVVLIFASFFYSKHDNQPVQLATVAKSDFEIWVHTIGTLDAERAHMISSAIKGDKGKVIFIVEDGKMVKEGDVLIQFDPSPFEADILRLTGEMQSREATVESAEQLLEWEKSQAESAVQTAEFNFTDADQEFSRYMSYIKDLENLEKKGFSYPNEIVQAKKKADQLNAKRQKAESDLAQTRKDVTFKVANAKALLNKAQSELGTTKLALEEARAEFAKTIVYAPFSGIAVHYEAFRDNQKRKPRTGDTVWPNQPLLYLPDISSMIVKTQVREVDLHKISKGQKATVRADAYPDVVFEGEVISIGALATEGAEGSNGAKYFQLTVTIKGNDSRLRPGMTARVFILTDIVKNAVTLPIQAVFDEEGKKICFLLKNKKIKRIEITTGKENEDIIQILSGLKTGDRVSLVKPSATQIF